MDYDTGYFINLIINTFICFSSPLNLAVYCSMSNQFRKQFKEILSPSCGNPRGGDTFDTAIIRTDQRMASSLRGRPPYIVENERCYYRKREKKYVVQNLFFPDLMETSV